MLIWWIDEAQFDQAIHGSSDQAVTSYADHTSLNAHLDYEVVHLVVWPRPADISQTRIMKNWQLALFSGLISDGAF